MRSPELAIARTWLQDTWVDRISRNRVPLVDVKQVDYVSKTAYASHGDFPTNLETDFLINLPVQKAIARRR